jgi:hypothetical protein
MACIHVVDKGATPSPFHYRAPSATRLGTICCAKPLAQHSTKKELVLLCSACALVNGWLPDEAVMMMRSPNHG